MSLANHLEMKHQCNIKKRTYCTLVKILHHIFVTLTPKSNLFMPHITESLYSWCWKGLGGYLLQTPCSSKTIYSCLSRIMSRCLLKTSEEGDCSYSGQPVPVICHPHYIKVLSNVQTEHPQSVSVCTQCLLPYQWAPMERAWFHFFVLSGICTHGQGHPSSDFSSPAWTFPALCLSSEERCSILTS